MYNTSGALPASPGAPTTYGESASHKPGEGSSWGGDCTCCLCGSWRRWLCPETAPPICGPSLRSSLPGLCSPEAEVACFQWLRESWGNGEQKQGETFLPATPCVSMDGWGAESSTSLSNQR